MTPSTTHARRAALLALLATVGCNGGGGKDGNGRPAVVGPALTTAPNNAVTCSDGFPVQINASFPQPFTFQGAGSCLLLTFFPGAQPATSGVAVSANIRIGPVTGPMRFVRMRLLYQNGFGVACCSAEQYGAVFTPAANATSTVALNFPMTIEHAPPPTDVNTVVVNDLLGLEVLAPNVPLPGIWTNNGGSDLLLPDYMWFPGLSSRFQAPTQNLRSEGSFSGLLPTFNMNFAARAAAASVTAP